MRTFRRKNLLIFLDVSNDLEVLFFFLEIKVLLVKSDPATKKNKIAASLTRKKVYLLRLMRREKVLVCTFYRNIMRPILIKFLKKFSVSEEPTSGI